MKGEDKMKQTIMGIGLIVGVLVGFVPSVDAQTQKKPVDIEACMSWKRVESPDISPTGRWVTYRIAPMEYNPETPTQKLYICLIHVPARRFCWMMWKTLSFIIRIKLFLIRRLTLQEI